MPGEGGEGGPASPSEAFELVGNEVRQEILLALSEPDGETLNTPVLPFSELYDRVDADVNSSNFNYHLQQLLGQFVEQREPDETAHPNPGVADEPGYALRPEGLLLTWIVRSGAGTMGASPRSFDAGFDCHHCDAPVRATYENAVFLLECSGCGYHYDYNLTPPGVARDTDDPEELLARVAAYNRTIRGGFARGVCPLCANAVDHRFVPAAETNYPRKDLREVFVHRRCDHCGYIDYLTVGELLLQEPALVGFCLEHGVDVVSQPIWELPFAATDECVTVEQTEPWTVRFSLTLDGETLELRVDDDLSTTRL
jgi:Zn ribbon nucleic-acid-binding protein